MNDEVERSDPKQTEKERIKAVRERIKNSKIFIDKTQPRKGVAIVGDAQLAPGPDGRTIRERGVSKDHERTNSRDPHTDRGM